MPSELTTHELLCDLDVLRDVTYRLIHGVAHGGIHCNECGDYADGLPHGEGCVEFLVNLVTEVLQPIDVRYYS